MRKQLILFALFISIVSFGQSVKIDSSPKKFAFQKGEWLKFRMSYSNFLNAGYSTIEVNEVTDNNKNAFHIIGQGKSTGFISLFFKVKDNYQTYIDKETLKPCRFIRKINEGGYTKNKEILFDYVTNVATVKDYKHNTVEKHPISNEIQDILSTLYYIRNQDLTNLKVGEEIELQMFFDEKITNFKLHFLGREIIKTKFGKIKTLKFRPLVQAGRVFKEKESLSIWITDDENKIPLRIKASLAVGSLRADLDAFKGLAHPFNIIFDN
ncbi:MAG: ATP-dependent exonuclease [Flavobacteriaceae bacterium]|nr:MAG: ATP-dependent exonuclease [Flavobacteriaceae bacterium]